MSFLDSLMYSRAMRNPGFAQQENQRMADERERRYLMEDIAANQALYDQAYGQGGLMYGFDQMSPEQQVAARTQFGNLAGLTSPLQDTRTTYGSQFGQLSEPMDDGLSDFQRRQQWFLDNPQEFSRYMAAMNQGKGSSTTVSPQIFMGAPSPGTEKQYEFLGKEIAGRLDSYREAATAATANQQALNRLAMELETYQQAGGTPGAQEALLQRLREYGQIVGLPVDDRLVAAGQSVEAAARSLVAEQLRLNKGPQTDFDAQYTEQFIGGLGTSPEANRAILRYGSSVNRLNQSLANLSSSAYLREDGRLNDFAATARALNEVDRVKQNAPAVIKGSSGKWVHYDDFYREGRARGMSDREIVDEWLTEARNRRQ